MPYGVHVSAGDATPEGREPILSGWAQYLQDLTNRPGWSVARLARESGVNRSSIFRWMSGKVGNVSANSVRAIAAAVGDDPDAVILTASDALNANSPEPGVESVDVWEARLIQDIWTDPHMTDTEKFEYERRVRANAADRRALDAFHERIQGRTA